MMWSCICTATIIKDKAIEEEANAKEEAVVADMVEVVEMDEAE